MPPTQITLIENNLRRRFFSNNKGRGDLCDFSPKGRWEHSCKSSLDCIPPSKKMRYLPENPFWGTLLIILLVSNGRNNALRPRNISNWNVRTERIVMGTNTEEYETKRNYTTLSTAAWTAEVCTLETHYKPWMGVDVILRLTGKDQDPFPPLSRADVENGLVRWQDMWRTILLLLLLPAGEAIAYSPARPTRHDVYSANGAFVLDVDPRAKRLSVYAANNRDKPLWSFDRAVWQETHLLSDDGKVVAVVAWRFVQVSETPDGVCIEFWNDLGMFKKYTFADVCPHPRRYWLEPGPVGSFWRTWYSEVEGDGAALRVRTTDEFEYVFAMDDGRILQATRIRLPWWSWWALFLLGAGGIAVFFVLWCRRKGRRTG
jgi:hypothetical protein